MSAAASASGGSSSGAGARAAEGEMDLETESLLKKSAGLRQLLKSRRNETVSGSGPAERTSKVDAVAAAAAHPPQQSQQPSQPTRLPQQILRPQPRAHSPPPVRPTHQLQQQQSRPRRQLPRSPSPQSSSSSSPSPPSSPVAQRSPPSRQTLAESDMAATAAATAAASGHKGQLAQQIHDEFLTCKICLENYKSPKSLSCLHTFCEDCIEQHANSESSYKKYSDYREFTCPLCRKRTQLPFGGVKKLPDNFLLSSLNEIVARQKPSRYPYCDICKLISRRQRDASSKCLDCNKLLCKACVEQHQETKVTRHHDIFDVEIEKDIECKEHRDEVVRFYCEPCETCVCVLCTFAAHKDHEISQFSDAVDRYKANIERLLASCKSKLERYEDYINAVGRCDATIREAEQKIRDVAIAMIGDIRAREKQLVDELHALYGAEAIELIQKKADMQATLDGLKSTCSLTELILKGKDMELLLLKKDVSEKLGSLSGTALDGIPETMTKAVRFVPGVADLGALQDMDRPVPKLRRRRTLTDSFDFRAGSSGGAGEDGGDDGCRSVEVQTESTTTKATVGCDKGVMTNPLRTENKYQMAQPSTSDQATQVDIRELQMVAAAAAGSVAGDAHERTEDNFLTPTSSVDEDQSAAARQSKHYDADEAAATRRRRRRERAQTARMENARYSYPSEAAPHDDGQD